MLHWHCFHVLLVVGNKGWSFHFPSCPEKHFCGIKPGQKKKKLTALSTPLFIYMQVFYIQFG